MWSISARIVATLIALISNVFIARVFGAESIGIVAVINSFMTLSCIFTVLGTDTSILRLIPEHEYRYSLKSALSVYRKSLFICLASSLVVSIMLFLSSEYIALEIFSKKYLSFYIAVSSAFVVFRSILLLNTQAIRGLKSIQLFSVMLIFPSFSNLFLLLLLSFFGDGVEVPLYAFLLSSILNGILSWIFVEYSFRQRVTNNEIVHPTSCKDILSISFPMLLTTSMTFVIGQTGIIILNVFRGDAEVGYYVIAVKLATLTTFILSAVNSMAAPVYSELFHSGKIEELFSVAQKTAKLIFWTTIPVLLVLVFCGKIILVYCFGEDFAVGYMALLLLTIGQFVNGISGSTGLFMNMTGNQKMLRNIMVIAAVLNVILSVCLIPKYGLYGAACGAAISLVFWNASVLFFLKLKYGKTTCYIPF